MEWIRLWSRKILWRGYAEIIVFKRARFSFKPITDVNRLNRTILTLFKIYCALAGLPQM